MFQQRRIEELREYFRNHSKCKEQKAHTSKVNQTDF